MTANGYTQLDGRHRGPGQDDRHQRPVQRRIPPRLCAGRSRAGIRYTTDPPYPSGIAADDGMPLALAGRRLAIWPNPLRGNSTIAWSLAREGRVSLVIYDAAGRLYAGWSTGR